MGEARAGIDLFWLPLGAGGHSVRLNGIVFEAVSARLQRRPRYDVYHAALEVQVPVTRYVIEMTPIRSIDAIGREVVAIGAVGARWTGRFRTFRYEVLRWRDGVVPDVAEAVDSPRHLTDDLAIGQVSRSNAPVKSWRPWNRSTFRPWSCCTICGGLAEPGRRDCFVSERQSVRVVVGCVGSEVGQTAPS
jgi:hypothetical protein